MAGALPWWKTSRMSRLLRWSALALFLIVPTALAAELPGGQRKIAFQLATGVGIEDLQRKVDGVQAKAVRGQTLTPAERQFLLDLYRAMAAGAERSIVLAQSGRLMNHYLDATGAPMELEPSIFRNSASVQANMARLRGQLTKLKPGDSPRVVRSQRFYMPHPSSPDSVFGLYWGTVQATASMDDKGATRLRWRAEVPWEWPSYATLRRKYGTPHAETFHLPNARSVVRGDRYALRIENGLGAHLVAEGLAKPFLAWAEWDD